MRRWIVVCAFCLLALLYPCDELLCWDTAGNRYGYWSEMSCDGDNYTGIWAGYVTNDCRFIGTKKWETVTGKINPSTKTLTATGISSDGCGSITIIGTFTSDFMFVTGNYSYSKGGGGTFRGNITGVP